jgi:hypothetical protein
MFNSTAAAPACSIRFAYAIQPALDDPFRLATTGIDTAVLLRRTSSRYRFGYIPYGPLAAAGKYDRASGKLSA